MRRNAIWLVAVAVVVAGRRRRWPRRTTSRHTYRVTRRLRCGDRHRRPGPATFKLSDDGNSITYKLNVANIENVTQAHIHMGPFGGTGGIVVWLFPSAPPADPHSGSNGRESRRRNDHRSQPGRHLAGQPLSALLDEISAGNAYVNVHTSQNRQERSAASSDRVADGAGLRRAFRPGPLSADVTTPPPNTLSGSRPSSPNQRPPAARRPTAGSAPDRRPVR